MRKFDPEEDMAVAFCPICGSKENFTSFSSYDKLHDGIEYTDMTCDNCDWTVLIYLLEPAKLEFEERADRIF